MLQFRCRYAADPSTLHLSPVGKQISALSDRWTSSEPPKYAGGGGGGGGGDGGGDTSDSDDKFFAVVLGSAGADAHIRAALERSPFEWDCVGYEPRSSRYKLNAASLALLERADVLVPGGGETVDEALLKRCPRVAAVSANAVGYQGIDLEQCRVRGAWVSNTPVFELRDATADSALFLMLAACRGARRSLELCLGARDGWDWHAMRRIMGTSPHRKTLGIVGFGRIGQTLAHKARAAFDMDVLYYDVVPNPPVRTEAPIPPYNATPVTACASLDELLAGSDFVSLHANFASESSRGMMGAAQFAAMRAGSFFVNTSRGAFVDERALAEALRSGHLAGAGIDVYEDEPRIAQELLACPSAFLTPHVSSACVEARKAMSARMVENALRVVRDGLAPLNALNAPPHALAALPREEKERVLRYLNDEFPAQHVTTAAEQKIIDAFDGPPAQQPVVEAAEAGFEAVEAAAHMRALAEEGEEDEEDEGKN